MGFYFRKSVNLKKGARINFSKSGIGVSTGIKGFRVGTGPKGKYVHMGRNGIYYRKNLSRNSASNKVSLRQKPTDSVELPNKEHTKNKKRALFPITIIGAFLFLPANQPLSMLLFIVSIFTYFSDKKRKKDIDIAH